ncbi:MAG: hypothetical protein ABS939_00655 [Psychrobacillus sp.]
MNITWESFVFVTVVIVLLSQGSAEGIYTKNSYKGSDIMRFNFYGSKSENGDIMGILAYIC